MKHSKKGLLGLQGFILFHLLWYLGAAVVKSNALPDPIKVYQKMPQLISKGIGEHLLASSMRLLVGIGISMVIGTSIGLAMGKSSKVNRILNPLIYFIYPIPKTALLPALMILYGLGNVSKVTLIILITVFQIIVAVRDSALCIEKQYYHVLTSLGAGKAQKLFMITLPAILPDLLTSLRLSVGTALSVLFFAENYGTKYGLGYYIQDAWGRLNYVNMYGGILALSFLGCMLFMLIDGLAYFVCKGK